jgi:hypothetical protein
LPTKQLLRGLLVVTAALSAAELSAATIDLVPGQSFEAAVESLNPGDTLIVHAGTYSDSGRISITVRGTAQAPVLIKGADGEALPVITRGASAAVQNTINIEGAAYLRLTRLEIIGNGGDGINMSASPSFITLDNLEVHNVDVGINFRSSMHHITVRRNHIHHTGALDGTGEGMYVGCNDATCAVSESLIENNWVHDTRNSTQGDGIEIKHGSHTNVVRDNVIHDTGYPCILVYGTTGNPVNVVEGNVMWNCRDSGIQAAADAIIRNNIILDSPANGFNSQSHQGAVPSNLQFIHNTIVGGSPCLRMSGWSGQPGLVFANNAVYCDSDNFVVGGLTGVTVSGNVIAPATSALPASGFRVGQAAALDLTDPGVRNVYPRAGSRLIDAGNAAYAAAVDFNNTPRSAPHEAGAYERTATQNPGWTVAPGFKNVAAIVQPQITLAANPTSVSAQETTQLTWSTQDANACTASANPAVAGWSGSKGTSGNSTLGPLSVNVGFTLSCTNTGGGSASRTVTVTVTGAAPAPTMSLSADPMAVSSGASSMLTWSSQNASGCNASGAWAGNKAASGSQSTGALSNTSTFDLECTGAGGSTSRTVTVTVNAGGGGPSPAPPSSTDEGGGGAVGLLSLCGLGALLARARSTRRQPVRCCIRPA